VLAGELLHEAIPALGEFKNPFEGEIWASIEADAQVADVDIRALRMVHGQIVASMEHFEKAEKLRGECFGVWRCNEEWEHIAVFPHIIEKWLLDMGFDKQAVLEGWRERGWIQCADQRYTWKVAVRGSKAWMICITREAIEEGTEGE
jgi:hypothetical protein